MLRLRPNRLHRRRSRTILRRTPRHAFLQHPLLVIYRRSRLRPLLFFLFRRRLLRRHRLPALPFPLLDTPDLHPHSPNPRAARQRQPYLKAPHQRVVILAQHFFQELRVAAEKSAQIGGAGAHDFGRVDAGDLGELLREDVVEDVVRDGDKDGAAEAVREKDQGGAGGHILAGKDGLDSDIGLLHAEAEGEAEEDLCSDPLGVAGGRGEGGDEARGDGEHDGGGVHPGGVEAEFAGKGAGEDGGDDQRQDEGQGHDAGADGGGAFDGLEPDGEVVDHDHHDGGDHEGPPHAGEDGALEEDARRDRGGFAFDLLDVDEQGEEDGEEDEEQDDAPGAPGVGCTAPLEGEEQADDAGEEDGGSGKVEL